MIELGGIKIEANENTVVYVKSSGNDDYVKYIINNTNFLNLQDDETIIDAFYFGGIHLEESKNATQSLTASYQYYAESSSYDSLDAIPTPAENHVYTVGGVRYIWFNSAWAEMTKDDDVSTAVSALIDYNCDLVRGDYA
jgi:hypothetical protein